jgi:hypothetical protein
MSVPARIAERWDDAPAATAAPSRAPSVSPRPLRRAAPPARPPAARPPNPDLPHPHRRARRGPHLRSWAFGVAIAAALAVGLVSLNAMRVDAAYRAHVLREEVREMLDAQRALVDDVARLSSPSRIGRWARVEGLVHPAPGDIVILQARRSGPATP